MRKSLFSGSDRRSKVCIAAASALATVLAAACSGGAELKSAPDPFAPDGQTGGGGAGGSPEDASVVIPTTAWDATMAAKDSSDVDLSNATLSISPPAATLVLTDPAQGVTQAFVASLQSNGVSVPVTASWVLDHYSAGDIGNDGVFRSSGLVGGALKVTATFNHQTVTADLNVQVKLAQTLSDSGPVAPANLTALASAPLPDPGGKATPPNPTRILYPYPGTVFPRSLVAPVLQFSPGTDPPEDVKVTIVAASFTWEGIVHVANGTTPQVAIPQTIWDGLVQSATASEDVKISVVKAKGGVAYGPAETTLRVAPASLKGTVFYQTYSKAENDANFGLWSVRPGVREPAKHLSQGCVVCHSVSANGTRLATGARDDAYSRSGIYDAKLDGTITQFAPAPADMPLNTGSDGQLGDTRGLAFASFTPDGAFVMRSTDSWWGGKHQAAWKVPANAPGAKLLPAQVIGLETVSAFTPQFSPDGKKLVFVNGDGTAAASGTARQSISVMDALVDPAALPNGSLSFSNLRVVLDNGAAGGSSRITKYPFFAPDSNLIVLQEGANGSDFTGTSYGGMNPSWTNNTGRLFGVRADTKEHVELTRLNTGMDASEIDKNYEPTILPVPAGGYFWVVFMSKRPYGNTFAGGNARKQLWVAAIDPKAPPGTDPSSPAFFLPNQSDTPNERGYWALEPCRSEGASCASGDECCDGFCRPDDPSQHPPSMVCKKPVPGQCAQVAEKCATSGDCCDVAGGVTCIGGFCTQPSPPPPAVH